MRLAILSDTHNHKANLQRAIIQLRQEKIETVLHCGDLTEIETALLLVEFRLIVTFGNGDWNANQIRQNLMYYRADNFGDIVYQGELDGVKIAATHGHLEGLAESLVESGEYAYVFTGHSHRRKDEMVRTTRLINPGALGGMHVEKRSFVILDLPSGDLDVHFVE
jgi:putative phosphoesterase